MATTQSFAEIHPEFARIDHLYTDELSQFLAEQETRRAKRARWFYVGLCIGIAVSAAAILLLLTTEANPFAAVLMFMGGFLIIFGFYVPLEKVRGALETNLLPTLAEGLSLDYTKHVDPPASFPAFQQLKLIPGFDRSDFEDRVAGQRQDRDFEIYEAHLEEEHTDSDGDTSWSTVFHGQLFCIDYHRAFLGRTILQRDAGFANRFTKPGREYQQVGLASPEFERAFEAWSTDQVEARYLLDPVVLERFKELERLYEGKNLRAAFADGKLYIAMETGDGLGVGSMFQEMDGRQRVELILREFATIFDLVDMTVKQVETPLGGAITAADLREI